MIGKQFQNSIEVSNSNNDIVDYLLTKEIDTLTLASNRAVDDVVIPVVDDKTAAAGNYLILKEDKRFFQAQITDVTDNNITIDSPLDYAFTTSAVATYETAEMNINGSITTAEFCASVPAGSEWEVIRMIFIIEDGSAMASSTFGGITALTNGVVVRRKNGTYKNLVNWKTNGDFANRAYDIAYDDRSVGSQKFAVRGRKTWNGKDKNDVVIHLAGDDGDELQALVQDDLTGLTKFNIVIQGRENNS